jgi:large subunit ribosomal protein L9
MQVILLERIASLGQMGDEVRVRDGFARNYLLPQGKALRANEANRKHFESQRSQLEARNLEQKKEADAVASKLDGQTFILVRQAAETGQLYGSVTPRDLAEAMTQAGFSVAKRQVALTHPIKTIGLHSIAIALHPDVSAAITANIARSADEAERQALGENLAVAAEEAEPAEAAAETDGATTDNSDAVGTESGDDEAAPAEENPERG